MEDLNKILTFEVKKELADRYFGFRKIIEEDSDEYQQKIISSALKLEKKIGFELVCIYILLRQESLIKQFSKLTGLESSLFYDSYVTNSATIRQRVLSRCQVHGFTRKRRFINLLFDSYKSLEHHVEEYRQQIIELMEDYETIKEEINIFYQKNDISGIMLFLRNLDGPTQGASGSMAGGIDQGSAIDMEQKMRMHPPQPVEKLLPMLPPIPLFEEIRKPLKKLCLSAFSKQPDFDPGKYKDIFVPDSGVYRS